MTWSRAQRTNGRSDTGGGGGGPGGHREHAGTVDLVRCRSRQARSLSAAGRRRDARPGAGHGADARRPRPGPRAAAARRPRSVGARAAARGAAAGGHRRARRPPVVGGQRRGAACVGRCADAERCRLGLVEPDLPDLPDAAHAGPRQLDPRGERRHGRRHRFGHRGRLGSARQRLLRFHHREPEPAEDHGLRRLRTRHARREPHCQFRQGHGQPVPRRRARREADWTQGPRQRRRRLCQPGDCRHRFRDPQQGHPEDRHPQPVARSSDLRASRDRPAGAGRRARRGQRPVRGRVGRQPRRQPGDRAGRLRRHHLARQRPVGPHRRQRGHQGHADD